VATSPPYYGLRSYLEDGHVSKGMEIGGESKPDCGSKGQAECGCYVCRMVGVFRGVWRVLHDSGTVWLNLGDSYREGSQLLGIPWRVALALQADGWVLRQDVIWHKPSPMPESVRNRCTKAHEYVFLLAKRPGYFCDMEAIKEKSRSQPHAPGNHKVAPERNDKGHLEEFERVFSPDGLSNKRSVWTVEDHTALVRYLSEHYPDVLEDFLGGSKSKSSVWKVPPAGYPGAHFAVYPPKLIEPCIRAGTSQYGCCIKCRAPWARVMESRKLKRRRFVILSDRQRGSREGRVGGRINTTPNDVAGVETKTVGWEPTCPCGEDVIPCTVLDPFLGSGTTCEVALENGRYSMGIDLSETYLKQNAIQRLEGVLYRRRSTAGLVPMEPRKPFRLRKS
jgi:DNA modification methylase